MPVPFPFVRVHFAGAVLVLAALVVATRAHAAEPSEVEDLIRQGVASRRAGNDNKALPFFQKAYELARTPRTSAQLGLVELALGYSVEAERHLSQGLASPKDPWIERNHVTLEDSVRRARMTIGEIAVTGAPVGAEVLINGRTAGLLPLATPIRIGQGPTTVELRASGYASGSAVVEVVAGKRSEVTLRLEKAGVPSQVSVARPAPAISIASQPVSQPAVETGRARPLIGWLLIGGGVATAGAGAALLLAARSDCTSRPGFECSHQPRSRTPAWALIGTGAAAAIAGGLVLLVRPNAQTEIGLGPSSIFLRGPL